MEAEDSEIRQGQLVINSQQAHKQISSTSASIPAKQSIVPPLLMRSGSTAEHKPAQTLAGEGSPRSASHDTFPRVQAVPAPSLPLETSRDITKAMITTKPQKKKVQVSVNHKSYLRLDCIGRGGSARVYRVMTEDFRILALKRVSLRDSDENSVQGFKGEIELLKNLTNVHRVVKFFDWEFNVSSNHLNLIMELGETDLDGILKRQIGAENSRLDLGLIRYYWKEMLECVASVHEYGIVHSDLKPANFLLVGGRLKLIDFGIAGTIQENTFNVHRESQVGTPNYMAPEALLDSSITDCLPKSGSKLVKLGSQVMYGVLHVFYTLWYTVRSHLVMSKGS